MKAKDKTTGQFKKVYVKALDSMPVGSEIDFNGSSSDIPTGWEQVTNPDSYSTSEVKTNKTWIDGKTIYRRIVEVNTTTTVNSATNLFQATYIDRITHCEYTVYAGALYYYGAIPVNLYYKPSTHYFQESHSDSWWNSQPMTIIIEYTKITN